MRGIATGQYGIIGHGPLDGLINRVIHTCGKGGAIEALVTQGANQTGEHMHETKQEVLQHEELPKKDGPIRMDGKLKLKRPHGGGTYYHSIIILETPKTVDPDTGKMLQKPQRFFRLADQPKSWHPIALLHCIDATKHIYKVK